MNMQIKTSEVTRINSSALDAHGDISVSIEILILQLINEMYGGKTTELLCFIFFFIFLLKTVQRKTWDSLDYFCKKVAFILGYRTQFAVTLPLKTKNEVLSLL